VGGPIPIPSPKRLPSIRIGQNNKNIIPKHCYDLLGKNESLPPLPPEPTNPIPSPPPVPMPQSLILHNICSPMADCYSSYKSKLIRMIKMIKNMPDFDPIAPPFLFQCTQQAAAHNWETIQKFGSLANTIQASKHSPIHYGSEFKPARLLAPLLRSHKYWKRFDQMLTNGSKFPMQKYPNETLREQDFNQAISYGNHKSAENNMTILASHIQKEISKGWIVPLLPEHAARLNNGMISPMGVVSQSTINDRGEIIPSNRVTHDLSFPGKLSGLSINSRTDMELLEPCQYGHMLVRTIHYIITLRLKFPNLPIALQKIDFKSAYRRQHLNADTAVQCMSSAWIESKHYVFLNLRLSFGGSACPSEWCVISETITDLANRILNDKDWGPRDLFPDLIHRVPESKKLSDDTPYKEAKPLLVDIPIERVGKADVYIDDVCTVGILSPESEPRLKSAVLLAMETVGRPISNKEPLPRDPLPSIDKLLSEADLSEEKCLLGWVLNTRDLSIRLHTEKYTRWKSEVEAIIAAKGVTTKKILEVTLGRLNHASTILPMARHFLCRLSFATSKAEYYKRVYLKQTVIDDLKLWIHFLEKLHNGISMNLITFRPPDRIIWTDACEYGLGGFSIPLGRAWTFAIPEAMRHRAHINILEFLAVLIGIWIEIIEGRLTPETCILAFGDNTSAMGWIHKSKYREECDSEHSMTAKLRIARKLASLSAEFDFRIYSQWFPGERNQVADLLSRSPSSDHNQLTNNILSQFPSQVPKSFKISPVPPEIESFAYNLLLNLPKPPQPQQDINASDQQYGENGWNSQNQSSSNTTHSSNPYGPNATETRSSPCLPNIFEDHETRTPKELTDWLKAQSEIPSVCWLRPSWKMDSKTQE
jgi:hypothetical protein